MGDISAESRPLPCESGQCSGTPPSVRPVRFHDGDGGWHAWSCTGVLQAADSVVLEALDARYAPGRDPQRMLFRFGIHDPKYVDMG